jgi:hypothetical protein
MSSAANGDTQTRGDEFGHQVVVHRHRRVGVLEHVCERRDALGVELFALPVDDASAPPIG